MSQQFQYVQMVLTQKPEKAVALFASVSDFQQKYRLTDKETNRLQFMLSQKGMSMNWLIYRVGRLNNVMCRLPYTVELLGDEVNAVFDQYLEAYPEVVFEFDTEAKQFADFLNCWLGDQTNQCYEAIKHVLKTEHAMLD